MTDQIVLERGTKQATMDLNEDEMALMDEISVRAPEKRALPKPKPSRPSPFVRKAPQQQHMNIDMDDPDLTSFMNPEKSRAPPPPGPEEWDGEEEGEEEEGGEEYAQQGGGGGGGGGSMPSDGYKSIEDEKADLLNKIARMAKKGFHTNARLNNYSDIEEIRTEYKRIVYGIEVDRSIKFQRRMLIAAVTGLEFLNKRFDPFDLQLDGWSENTMENADDYDGVFEELFTKYKDKVAVAPEVKLIMMVGGSAMMFHLTNSMFKSAMPSMSQVVKQNPELVQNMMSAVQRTQNSQMQGPPEQGLRREMQGPGIDFGSLMNMMGPPPAMNRPVGPRDDESVSDIVSIDLGSDTKEVTVPTGPKKRGGRKPKATKKEISLF